MNPNQKTFLSLTEIVKKRGEEKAWREIPILINADFIMQVAPCEFPDDDLPIIGEEKPVNEATVIIPHSGRPTTVRETVDQIARMLGGNVVTAQPAEIL